MNQSPTTKRALVRRRRGLLLGIGLCLLLVSIYSTGQSGCGKAPGTVPWIADSCKILVQPGRGVPEVCEVGMSFEEIKNTTSEASRHGQYDRSWNLKRFTRDRFVLVPSLGVIGVPERKGALALLTFYVQPYDSSITCPGLMVNSPFRGSVAGGLSFSNHVVSRNEVEAAFGMVTQELTNFADFSKLPSKTQPFSFRGEELYYNHLGLSFALKSNAVTSFTVFKPAKSE